ncbi:hypothetical protein J4226_01460 [Candidatus Pacearchaeota archaeon]|nr:hypothetical protein [Candidatus Pacearchaeota archaeon]
MAENGIIRRCCICGATQINGEYFRGSFYYGENCQFSDGIFSEKCFKFFYENEDFGLEWELKECPTFEDIRG